MIGTYVNKTKFARFFLATEFALIIFLADCTALSGPARIDPQGTTALPSGFPGLLPQGENETTYIFQIHGIWTLDPTYGEDILGKFKNFGYDRDTVSGKVDAYGDPRPAAITRDSAKKYVWNDAVLHTAELVTGQGLTPTKFDHFGVYEKDIFTNSLRHNKIVVYTYYWRWDLWRIDGHYLDADIDANQRSWPSQQKSLFDEWIKTGLMDQGLSDVAGYLGPMGKLEREGIESTLCAMFADAMGTSAAQNIAQGSGCLAALETDNESEQALVKGQVTFDFVSHSLGSRMLFDVLSPYDPDANSPDNQTPFEPENVTLGANRSAEAQRARAFIAQNTNVFFMAANQLPMLATGAVAVTPAPSVLTSEMTQTSAAAPPNFFDLRASSGNANLPASVFHPHTATPVLSDLAVVAFQDPDDLLGFKASDGATGGDHAVADRISIVDVIHRNTDQYLYLFVLPGSAHNHETSEPNSLRMILCGATTKPNGELKANSCP